MKMRSVVLLAALAIACLCTSASAATYYVATTGDDANPGTESQPWATLDYAVDQISPGDTILVKSGTYAGCRIENSGQAGAPCTLKADDGATVVINTPGATCRHDSNIEVEWYDGTVSYWIIEGFEVSSGPRSGIDLRDTEHITIRDCYVHDSGSGTGIFLAFSYYPVIEDCESSYNGEHGFYQSNSGDYHEVRNCVFHHNVGCGIHHNGDERYTPGDGLISYGLIEKNVIYQNGTGGGAAINGDGLWYTKIYNNLVYDNRAGGIALYVTDAAAASSYCDIYNNTLVFGTDGRDVINIPGKGKDKPLGHVIRNNILYTEDSGEASIMVWGPDALAASDYNVVIDRMSIDGKSIITLAEWQSYGFDTHSFISTKEALFVDPATFDYHQSPTTWTASPARRATPTTSDVMRRSAVRCLPPRTSPATRPAGTRR